MAKIALCIIATNAYIDFVSPLLWSADKYFLIGHEVEYHVFSNKGVNKYAKNHVITHGVKHEPWPAMTLKRYHIYTSVDLSGYDYVFHIDADMLFVAPVGDEILGELVGVIHPGFYRGGGSWETRKESEAYVAPAFRSQYIAGGFQGGSRYYPNMTRIRDMVDIDLGNGITAVWNDESYWNAVKNKAYGLFTILPPSYCMVEEPEKRKAWGIDHFQPKIIALAKDHSKYQK